MTEKFKSEVALSFLPFVQARRCVWKD